jgi:hypothetical protein
MKTEISDAVFCILVVVALIWSCDKSTIIDMVESESVPEEYIPRTKSDTTEVNDSVPITFSVSVEGWKEIEVNP